MGSGKDEKQQMDPLFPRLHINDTEKRGPRAPPRNKMALCEETSVTLHRPSSESISMQPLPPGNCSSLNPSGSQSRVGCQRTSRFSLDHWLGSSEKAEDHHSHSSSLINFDTRLTSSETQILKPGKYQKFSSIRPSKVINEYHFPCPFSFYNCENSYVKTLGKEDNFRLPYISQLEKTLHCGVNGDKLENQKLTSSSLSSFGRHQTTSGRREEEVKSTDLKSSEHLGNWTDDNHEVSEMREKNVEAPLSIAKKILPDTSVNPLTRSTTTDSSTGIPPPMYQAQHNVLTDKTRLHDPCEQSHQVCRTSLENAAGIYENVEKLSRKRNYSTMEGLSCANGDPGEKQTLNLNEELINECSTRDNDSELGDAKSSIDISGAVGLKSGSNISPDDVVGVLGQKLFWKVRRTIAHQQRIFGVQIFELHRLIRVQRLVAKSPEMLCEDILHISKPSTKYSPVGKPLTQNIPEATTSLVKPTVDSQRPNMKPEIAAEEDAHAKLPPLECDSDKGHTTPRSTPRPCSGSLTSPPFSSDVKLGPWCFHPGHQWLVPVRSPSEGLVYKPYTESCSRTLDCIAPVYGSHGVPILSRVDRDSVTYGVPNPSQNSARSKPYPIPVVDTKIGGPVKRVQKDAVSLFPIDSPCETSRQIIPSNVTVEPQRIQVIKVVPHNPKLAWESAARIFKSIQEEREKHD